MTAAKKTKLKGVTLHSLRLFFNTFCVNGGIPERAVKAWLGHRDRSMTGVYYHLTDEESLRFMRAVPFGENGVGEAQADKEN